MIKSLVRSSIAPYIYTSRESPDYGLWSNRDYQNIAGLSVLNSFKKTFNNTFNKSKNLKKMANLVDSILVTW